MRVGIDIGGTFTDLCLADDSGIIAVAKSLTTTDEPARAVESLLRSTLADIGVSPSDIASIVHGTTLVTNAIIERKGARTALLTTAGFRDVLEIRRETRYDLYDIGIEFPPPLVPRYLRFDIPERTLADGTIEQEVDADLVRRLGDEFSAKGVDAVAVCFLHGFTNPANESAARSILNEAAPALRVALSSEIAPEMGEYERTSTTVASAYVQGLVERYLVDLRSRFEGLGIEAPLYVMFSNGGLGTSETAARFPIKMLESGPAAGALAAARFGSDQADVLSFDMGGTTAKVCSIEDGAPLVANGFEVDRRYRMKRGSGFPIRGQVIDMIEIGAGGGSIAALDSLGMLTVGPHSAGSDPGPACYGSGGTEPTVTDADLVLGYLDPDFFLGGDMKLDVEAARAAIRDRIAEPLGLDVEVAAWGIHQLVNETMANAARVHAIERGKDAAGTQLFAFGGAGPVHAAGVAARLGMARVIVGPGAGVMSAAGLLAAPLAFDFVRSRLGLLDELSWDDADSIFLELEEEAKALLADSGLPPGNVQLERFADMRLSGQGHDIRVPAPSTGEGWPGSLAGVFKDRYLTVFGRRAPEVDIEIVSWRLMASGPDPELTLTQGITATEAQPTARRAWFGKGWSETKVLNRDSLAEGDELDGPTIVQERESTTVVPPGTRLRVDGANLVVILDAGGDSR